MERLLLTAFMIGILVGCGGAPDDGPPRVDVSGVITLDGQPIAKAGIFFQPKDGGPGVGCAIQDGLFSTDSGKGAVAGPQVVNVTFPDWGEEGTEGVAVLSADVPNEGTDSLILTVTKDDVKAEE